MKVSQRALLLLAAAATSASAAVRGGGDRQQVDLLVADLQSKYEDLYAKYEDLSSKHDTLQAQYDTASDQMGSRHLANLPRSSCNCASLTVAGDTHIGGATKIYGDTTLAGPLTTVTGTSMAIQSKKTEIDGDVLTIQTSGAGTRTGESSAINIAGGAITADSLTVSGESFLGGGLSVMGDVTLSGSTTTIVGDELNVKSKRTEIDGEMATIKSRSIGNRGGEPATTSININGGSMAILADSMMMRGFEYFTVNADKTTITGEMNIVGPTSIKGEHFSVDGGLVSYSKNTAMIVDGTVAFNNVTSIRDLRGKNLTITESLMMCGMFEAGLPECSR
mmetsp:Transcript_6169/g.11704  ORF Transcript_6169/g.11704 Transcript_6169/m.11704 type:complete len:335 (-) Transcript_6169:1353-2357(-)